MKNVFVFLCVLLFTNYSFAQEDRFTDYSQLVDKSVVLYDLQSLVQSNGKFIFKQVDGKLKAISPKIVTNWGNALRMKCIDVVDVRKKQYIHFNHEIYGDLFFLVVNPKKNYIDKFRSITYWNSFIKEKGDEYSYLYDDSKSSVKEPEKYTKISWDFAELPLSNIDSDVLFHYTIIANSEGDFISYSNFSNYGEKKFRSSHEYERAVVEQQKLDSIREMIDRKLDEKILAVECIKEYEYRYSGDTKVNIGDTIFVYEVDNYWVRGWHRYAKIYIPTSYIKPLDNEQYDFLKYRKKNNLAFRDSIAKNEAYGYAKRYLVRLERKMKELEAKLEKELKAIEAKYKKISTKQLFFKDYDYIYGDYGDLGMKFEIHNCWKKTIKYVEFTTMAYNVVGDVQRDWVGKSISKVKGIGPLDSGETASWSFEDMFYDRNDVINKVKLTKITFIFMDGTTKTFSGANNINKHRWSEMNL